MRRDQLEHAIRTACQIISVPAVIVVGSQSILATFNEEQLPAAATMSIEVDILPIGRPGPPGPLQHRRRFTVKDQPKARR